MVSNTHFDFARFLETYKGGISVLEGKALARSSENVGTGCVVRIGSYIGKSAMGFSYGIFKRDGIAV